MSSTLFNNVIQLLNLGVGDRGRLEHIENSLEENKTLYSSDKDYVENLIEQHIKNQEIKSDQTKDSSSDESVNAVYCSKCGNKIMDDSSFCKNCGTKIRNETENKFCGKCGNKIFGNNSCSNCNQQHSTKNNNTNPNYVRQRPTEWKSEGTTLILTIILGIFGLGGIGHIYLGNITKGIVILIVGIILLVVSIFTFGIGLIILIPFAIWVVFDSRSQCRYYNDYLEKNGKSPW